MGRGVHYNLIGDAASRRGLSRVGSFITLNGPLNGHQPSICLHGDTVEPLLYDHPQNHIGVVV